jgi:hypothetical protein
MMFDNITYFKIQCVSGATKIISIRPTFAFDKYFKFRPNIK